MAETPSSMVPLGTEMPCFSLPDAHGNTYSLNKETEGTLVIFMCNHCPFVVHIADTLNQVNEMCKRFRVEMIGINANDIQAYPDDAPAKMVVESAKHGWQFPYLFDESQEVAKQFHATCTPDTFLFDAKGKLFYRGQIDDSRPNNCKSDGNDILNALKALVDNEPPPSNQKPALGCNIKWK
jgi:peroxiredoxin